MSVKDQYEAYPYPERDPKDEAKRLITGSPSHPLELDNFLFRGQRDWAAGTRILVAGGGSGDALIQLAQLLTSAGKDYEIIYIDLSKASREIAEARAKARGLKGIKFVTGSLLDAPDYGQFDYIDCCGVLHHLPEPQAGFDALAKALRPEGGFGGMVYAPYGRSGVYPLQEAFMSLSKGMAPEAKLKQAKKVFAALPGSHPFKTNPHLVDHKQGDAGFYDLLLHSQDRPYRIDELDDTLGKAGLALAGLPQAPLYDLSRFVDPIPEGLDPIETMAVAEKLDGTIKTHVFYAKHKGSEESVATGRSDKDVPHLKGVSGQALAQQIANKGQVGFTLNGTRHQLEFPKASATVLAAIDGRRDLASLRNLSGINAMEWGSVWQPVHRGLTHAGLMLYSRLLH